MAEKKGRTPGCGTVVRKGIRYYRTRTTGVDRRRVDLYVEICEELHQEEQKTCRQVEEAIFCKGNPAVTEYCEKWLLAQSVRISPAILRGYTINMNKYIVESLGSTYLSDVTADDIWLALTSLTTKSVGLYNTVNVLLRYVSYSAGRSQLLDYNPCEGISAKRGEQAKRKEALTDEQIKVFLDAVRELPPYTFIMIALHSGLRQKEVLGFQWDCVLLDTPAPCIPIRRAWQIERSRPMVSITLKTKAAHRDIFIPECLVDLLQEVREKSISKYVIADSREQPPSYSQFQRVWKCATVRAAEPRNYYKYVNGQSIKYTVTPTLGSHQKNNPKLTYVTDFNVTPHQLRHTYITSLLYAGVDPKTAQHLAGYENSKTTMDTYAQVKYNKPERLMSVVNAVSRQ